MPLLQLCRAYLQYVMTYCRNARVHFTRHQCPPDLLISGTFHQLRRQPLMNRQIAFDDRKKHFPSSKEPADAVSEGFGECCASLLVSNEEMIMFSENIFAVHYPIPKYGFSIHSIACLQPSPNPICWHNSHASGVTHEKVHCYLAI